MHRKNAILWLLVILVVVPECQSTCPKLLTGKCFIDCTQELYRIVCEEVTGKALHLDLEIFAGLNASFSLRIWNIPGISRLGGNIFAPVTNLMVSFEMQNAVNLRMFPELATIVSLKNITIRNAPKLNHLPLELLPDSVESISLTSTGITQFISSQTDVNGLPNLRRFKIDRQKIEYISRFFVNFPRIESISITDCIVNALRISNSEPFVTSNPLILLKLVNNTYHPGKPVDEARLFYQLLMSLTINSSTVLELIGNDFPITKESVHKLDRISVVKRLSLFGSTFNDYVSLVGVFENFTNLEYLDVGHTEFPYFHGGALRGLPKLKTLKMDGNGFRDLSDVNDIFEGLSSDNLTILDLSDNALKTLPAGLQRLGENITELYLANNFLQAKVFWEFRMYFRQLRVVGLRSNKMTEFSGLFMGQMKKLEVLDLSCNKFETITKKFFSSLPASLKTLNMTFCVDEDRLRPHLDEDVFSKFSPVSSLHLGSGFFKSHILRLLQRMPERAAVKLKELHLEDNRISYLAENGEYFSTFTNLETLDLSRNMLQSISPGAFSPLKNLKSLRLSGNALFSIGPGDFSGLSNLQYLDISENNIVLFLKGALDDVPDLKALFAAGNKIFDLLTLFVNGGKKLEHLGFDFHLEKGCVNPKVFTSYRNLKWMYVNKTLPVFLDMDPLLNTFDQEAKYPMHPWTRIRFCEDGLAVPDLPQSSDTFLRIAIEPNGNKIYQNILGFFPATCFSSKSRFLVEVTANFVCPSAGNA